MMADFLVIDAAELTDYVAMGGFVMWPLILVSVVLWYALAMRYFTVKPGSMDVRQLLSQAKAEKALPSSVPSAAVLTAMALRDQANSRKEARAVINERFSAIRADMNRHRMLVRTLVAVAPLLGLLGTVDGMIETFDSLAEMALFTQSGGIAGGISRALFTTQMGLAVSIPGLLAGRMIERREETIRFQLDQIRDLLCATFK